MIVWLGFRPPVLAAGYPDAGACCQPGRRCQLLAWPLVPAQLPGLSFFFFWPKEQKLIILSIWRRILRLRAAGGVKGARLYLIFMAVAPGEASPIPSHWHPQRRGPSPNPNERTRGAENMSLSRR